MVWYIHLGQCGGIGDWRARQCERSAAGVVERCTQISVRFQVSEQPLGNLDGVTPSVHLPTLDHVCTAVSGEQSRRAAGLSLLAEERELHDRDPPDVPCA